MLPCLEGGGPAMRFGPAIFPFCSPSLPVINYQSLRLKHELIQFRPICIIMVDFMGSGGGINGRGQILTCLLIIYMTFLRQVYNSAGSGPLRYTHYCDGN